MIAQSTGHRPRECPWRALKADPLVYDILRVHAASKSGSGQALAGLPDNAPHILVEGLALFTRLFSRCEGDRLRAERKKRERDRERKTTQPLRGPRKKR